MEKTFILTRESNFGHLTGKDRVEVMRGMWDEVTAKCDELADKFTELLIDEA